jgi:ABC-type uncharacterized transport system auxiliary subunit
MKFVVIALALTALLGGCVSRTVERETVVDRKAPSSSTVVVPQGATSPPSTTVVVPQSTTPPPSGDTTIVVPAR